jgi:7-cyano-7-deazaguanine synthase in queuosine biosynthesis
MYSGGLDSLIAYYYLKWRDGRSPLCVYATLGHRYQQKELQAMSKIYNMGGPAYVIDNSLNLGAREENNANIPQRNMFLAMVGAHYGDEIYLVCQKGEQDIPDRSPEFFEQGSKMLSLMNGKKITLSPVFDNYTKTEMVKWFLREDFDLEILKASVSCYSNMWEKQCGACPSCFRRWVSMYLNGVEEEYASDPWQWEGVAGYLDRIKNNHYIKERSEDILEALKRKGVQ